MVHGKAPGRGDLVFSDPSKWMFREWKAATPKLHVCCLMSTDSMQMPFSSRWNWYCRMEVTGSVQFAPHEELTF